MLRKISGREYNALQILFFVNLSHLSYVRITDVKNPCESFTEVKDSHIFITSVWQVSQIHSNVSHLGEIRLTFTFERICPTSEKFARICHTCDNFERILHRCDEYVRILHTFEIRHL